MNIRIKRRAERDIVCAERYYRREAVRSVADGAVDAILAKARKLPSAMVALLTVLMLRGPSVGDLRCEFEKRTVWNSEDLKSNSEDLRQWDA